MQVRMRSIAVPSVQNRYHSHLHFFGFGFSVSMSLQKRIVNQFWLMYR
jgi:hypothetical protein